MSEHTGWLLSYYAHPERGILLWVLCDDGQRRCLFQDFPVTFYAAGPDHRLRDLWIYLRKQPFKIDLARPKDGRRDLVMGETVVLAATFESPAALSLNYRSIINHFPDLTFYDIDFEVSLRHAAKYGSYPLARCFVATDDRNRVQDLQVLSSKWDIDQDPAPLRILTLEPDIDPSFERPRKILVHSKTTNNSLDIDNNEVTIPLLKHILQKEDPDFIITKSGDTYLLPLLFEKAARFGEELPWNRDMQADVLIKKERSYHAYNQVVYRGQQFLTAGRIHLDVGNTVMYHEYGLDGVLEMARVTSMPIQTAARVSPGTGISSMQIVKALELEILVPIHKGQAETPKTPSDLMDFGKGGMIFDPIIGVHPNVAEVDFFSMYPKLMEMFNISTETGPLKMTDEQVSHLVKMVASDEPGLIPQTLSPLLKKRFNLKNELLNMVLVDGRYKLYKACASAEKWLLVTCFGYLNFQAARFGRVESYEAVTAYGREVMLRAKEAAEDMGGRVLHMYIDGLWVVIPGLSKPQDFKPLLTEITSRTTLPIALEGVYKWVAFLPSKKNEKIAVPNQYFGIFQDGEIKTRGIEARRHDTPAFIKNTQIEILEILASANDIEEVKLRLIPIQELIQSKLSDLGSGRVPLKDLVVHMNVRRSSDQFKTKTSATFAALEQLESVGKALQPGQSLPMIYTRGSPRARAWNLPNALDPHAVDYARYRRLFLRAVNTILQPITGETYAIDGVKQLELDFNMGFAA